VAHPGKAKTADGLSSYRSKRDFERTREPPGGEIAGAEDRRFVIQEHHARRLHWDLRLERGGVLVCWAIPKGLPESPGENHFAALTEEHPLEYLEFEGQIPKGQYGAGTMKVWDRGTYEILKWEPRKVEVSLHGRRVDARYALFATAAGREPKDWMIHRMDAAADPSRELMPRGLKPMLASTAALPSDDQRWAYEIKWDGVRAIAYSQPGELRLQSRNLNDVTGQYPELAPLNRALSSHSAVLDGEIVAFDEHRRPSFAALQPRMHVGSRAQAKRLAQRTPVTYMIFDLLWLDGHSLMEQPYAERVERLAALELKGASWQTPEHIVGGGERVLAASDQQRLEGIVAKRLDSTYQPGRRTTSWLKVKNFGRQELVIGGWMPGKGRRSDRIGALLVGVYEPNGQLRYAGRVGTGFSEQELDRLSRLLAGLRRESSPFAAGAKPPPGAVFCEPRLVAEIEFREWTRGGSLRQPSYKGLREDKAPEEVVREDQRGGHERREDQRREDQRSEDERREDERRDLTERALPARLSLSEQSPNKAVAVVEGHELKLSNRAKVLYPQSGFTKGDVIDYYAAAAAALTGHLEGRPLTVKRWPDGVEGSSFFQKQAPAHRPAWVQTVTVPSGRKPIDYVLANDAATLVWLANLAALELHTPLARAEAIERPTVLVFDLDPGEPATIVECCHVALALQGMFEQLGLESFAKTSGSKGLQVYVPLNTAELTFADTKPFAKAVAELLERAEPELVVSRMTRARRTGKVLIDWSQNDRRKTTVCVYSLRAGPHPTVSAPVSWDEVRAALRSADPASLVLEAGTVLERLADRGDEFAPVLSLTQRLPAL
jgi:bifunctional non-homologous end joining protein LigD